LKKQEFNVEAENFEGVLANNPAYNSLNYFPSKDATVLKLLLKSREN